MHRSPTTIAMQNFGIRVSLKTAPNIKNVGSAAICTKASEKMAIGMTDAKFSLETVATIIKRPVTATIAQVAE